MRCIRRAASRRLCGTASMEERNREEIAKLKQEMEVLKRGLESLQAFITDVPPITVAVRCYERLKCNNDAHTSPAFYTHPRGYKMCVKVWPNGVLDGKNGHVSVACHMMRSENDADLKWPFCGNVHLRLVNQGGSDGQHRDHFIRYTHRTPRHLSGRVSQLQQRATATTEAHAERTSYGNYLTRFIAHAELNNSAAGQSYLINDTLVFIVTKIEVR